MFKYSHFIFMCEYEVINKKENHKSHFLSNNYLFITFIW